MILLIIPATGESFMEGFIDPKDGALDTSQWLIERKGFLPVPILVTEPAVGYGAGAALLFFHESVKDAEKRKVADEDAMLSLPPSVSAVAGAYTENNSWFVGGGHFGSWRDDSIRYTGGLGGGSLKLKFYGIGGNPILDDKPLKFTIDAIFFVQEMKFRIMGSKFFIGGRYSYLTSENTFNISETIPQIPDVQLDSKTAGFTALLNYDTRDNIFTPNRGHNAYFDFGVYDEALGGTLIITK